ncbi:MAG: transposase, partial [Planctomycetaceae bacterium]
MAGKKKKLVRRTRRSYPDNFKRDAVQMRLDGYSASEVCERLGISNTNTLYRWKQQHVELGGPVADTLDARVKELEAQIRRVERERDILKKLR